MMHFAATGVSLLALIFAAVGAFTAFMVFTDDGEVIRDTSAKGQCAYGDGATDCSTYEEMKESFGDNWAGSTMESFSLAGTFSLIAFIFSIVLFLLVAGATGLKVGSVLDAGKRKLMFLGGAGVGGLAALLSMIGWIMIVSAWTNPEGTLCPPDWKECSLAESAAEQEAPYALGLGIGFVFQILAFIFLAATAGLSAAAGMQEEGEEAKVSGEA